ncbi:MAG: hypothetical protein NVS3B12_23940 [Acidimicrobiales bacterium]
MFIWNVRQTDQHGLPAGDDPWDARTLEWITPNPTPEYNFIEVPTVHSVDEFWHRKYTEDEAGRLVKIAESAEFVQRRARPDEHIHVPSPSYYPLVATLGLPTIAYGQIYRLWAVSVIGVVVLLGGLFAWGIEPSTEPPDPDDVVTGHAPELSGGHTPELAGVGASGGGAPALPAGPGDTIKVEDGSDG